jgi:hypothetical protein
MLLFVALTVAPARAQELPGTDPAAALSEALSAACRQNEQQFLRFLTADNAVTFQELPAGQRIALLKRFVQLDEVGRPLLSAGPEGRTVLRCETPGVTVEMQFGPIRLRENLAFLPVDFALRGIASRRVTFGLVREGGGWKLLSVGLLLLDLPALAKQWAQAELETREAEAIAALRKLADAAETYRRAFGKLPETLAQLGPPPPEGISPAAAGLVDAELAAGKKGGYVFQYLFLPAKGEGAEARFELTAAPAEYGKTGRRSFFLDSSATLRGGDKMGAAATAADPRIEAR